MPRLTKDSGPGEQRCCRLSPAPGWAAYPGETERLLAWRPDNCTGTAAAWDRLKAHRFEELPPELSRRIPLKRLSRYLHCWTHGEYLDAGDGGGCSACVEQRRLEEDQLRQAEAGYQRKLIEERKARQARLKLDRLRLDEFQRRFDEQTGRRERT